MSTVRPIIRPRQRAQWLSKDHRVNKPFAKNTKAAELFADDGACMMQPLVSEGPLCEQSSPETLELDI